MNTTKQRQSHKNSDEEFVEFDDISSAEPRFRSDHVEVLAQFIDQDSQKFAKLRQGNLVALCPHALFTSNSPWEKLQKLTGITVISTATKSALTKQLLDGAFSPAFCLKRLGWNGRYYALGDEVFTPDELKSTDTIISLVSSNSKYTHSCTVDDYWKPLIPLIKKQELLLFAYGPAFLGPLLQVMEQTEWNIPNPVFDYCGVPGSGKTTAAILLAGSTWGTGSPPLGFGESWNFTEGGIEEHLLAYNDGWLGLDEANKARQGAKGPELVVPETVFFISDGRPKKRHHTFGPQQPNSRVAVVSTSNDPLNVVGSPRKAEAVAARCISIHIPNDRKHGVLSYLPEGAKDSASVVERLTMLALKNYGSPIRHFLAALVNARHDNSAGLVRKVSSYANEFIDEVGKMSSSDRRRAKPFALAYAAARLAREFGTMPSRSQTGSLKAAFVKVWSMATKTASEAPSRGTPAEILRKYVRRNRKSFVKQNERIEMSDKEFKACVGFRHKGVGGRRELILSKEMFSKFSFSAADKKILKRDGHLVADKARYDAKRSVRLVKGKPELESVYVIHISSLSEG